MKIQKRLVLGNLKEIYQQFYARNPERKVGFSPFAMLHPKECVLAGNSCTHSVCICTIQNNVTFMMTGSKMDNVTENEEVLLNIIAMPLQSRCATKPLHHVILEDVNAVQV